MVCIYRSTRRVLSSSLSPDPPCIYRSTGPVPRSSLSLALSPNPPSISLICLTTRQAFVADFEAGKLEPHVKSAPIPEDDGTGVTTVVGKNFKEVVTDSDKDVFIEFYAPWWYVRPHGFILLHRAKCVAVDLSIWFYLFATQLRVPLFSWVVTLSFPVCRLFSYLPSRLARLAPLLLRRHPHIRYWDVCESFLTRIFSLYDG